MSVRLRGRFDVAAFTEGMRELTARHEALRTTFTGNGRKLTQVIHEPAPVAVGLRDLSGIADNVTVATRELADEVREPVDPAHWPLRVRLWRLSETDHIICLNLHHMINDARSFDIIWAELAHLYNGLVFAAAPLAPVTWQYADFTQWQRREVLDGPRFAELADFWQRELTGMRLPDLPGEETPVRRGALISTELGSPAVAALSKLARQRRATPFAVLLAAFYAALQAVTGEDDITVASLYANRSRPEVANTVGFLANMVLLRARLPHQAAFPDIVAQAQRAALNAFLHQDLPYQVFPLPELQLGRRTDSVVFHAHPSDPSVSDVRFAGTEAEWLPPDPLASRFEVELRLVPSVGGMACELFYNEARIPGGFATDLITAFEQVCEKAIANPHAPKLVSAP